MRKELETKINEYERFGNKEVYKMLVKSSQKTLQGIEKDLNNVELQMKEVINNDGTLKQMYELMLSIVGIGHVTALQLIVHTNEMTLVSNPRSLACHCGVAPFERSSGLFKGKGKVSHMANKRLKTALHMAALSAIKLDEGLKRFYERKVLEGKNKMSVINAIRNKLIHRIFAIIKRNTPYRKEYKNEFNNLNFQKEKIIAI